MLQLLQMVTGKRGMMPKIIRTIIGCLMLIFSYIMMIVEGVLGVLGLGILEPPPISTFFLMETYMFKYRDEDLEQ